MTATISRLYDDYATASQAVRQLESAGIDKGDISLVASNADNWYDGDKKGARTSGRIDRDRDGVDDRAEGAAAGGGIGATVGGAAGLLAGLGLLAIPGIGPVVAAGWLAATAVGAAAGAATGGIIGALSQSGIGEDEAHVYAEGVRRGGTLVTVRACRKRKRPAWKRFSIAAQSTSAIAARRIARAGGRNSIRTHRSTPPTRCAKSGISIAGRPPDFRG